MLYVVFVLNESHDSVGDAVKHVPFPSAGATTGVDKKTEIAYALPEADDE